MRCAKLSFIGFSFLSYDKNVVAPYQNYLKGFLFLSYDRMPVDSHRHLHALS